MALRRPALTGLEIGKISVRLDPETAAIGSGVGPTDKQLERRLIWRLTRSVLEADNYKHRRYGEKSRQTWPVFETLIGFFGVLLKMVNLYEKGYQNAIRIVVNRLDLRFDNLPAAFDGYTLLHLTDLHPDFIPGYAHRIFDRIRNLSYDACVMTGDFRGGTRGGIKRSMDAMETIVGGIRATDGIYATLGNHDSHLMVDPLEQMGVIVLANESAVISRNGDRIHITGIDDPYYYYTDRAIAALEESPEGFKIAMVHTPALFDAADDNGYRLYLCGHTHGGQICLPGGYPIITHVKHGRKYYRGLWRYGKMTGYTSQGCGTVGIPVRFNTQSEVTLIKLHRA